MNKQYQKFISPEEMSVLSGELDPEEIFILGFLRGFNRKNMKEWGDKDFGIFQSNSDF